MALEDAGKKIDEAITRTDPRGLAYENAFAGATSFLRRKYTKDLSGFDVAVTGIPFDQAVTNRTGARFGPRAIREASTLQPYDPPYGWGFDPLTEFAVADYGDMAFDYAKVWEFPAAVERHIAGMLEADVGTVVLGGDHFVTLPVLRAHVAKHGPLALIQFDAHSDTWADDDMERIDHGTFVYKAAKLGLIDVERSVQIGIRTVCEDHCGIHVIDAPEVHRTGPEAVAAKVKEIVGDARAYLTFDIDCLDPAFAPGTGTPVWGGMSSAQAAAVLRGLAGVNLTGGDVVEVSPPFDHGGITAVAGAHVAMELLCLWGWTRR